MLTILSRNTKNTIMKSLPKISFVIPVYNRADMVLECLQSLKEQTISEWEAIVVDDNSDDNLFSAIEGYDPRVRYALLPKKRGSGVSSARNYGNLIARSPLIAVLDSDDLAKPIRAERAIKSYAENNWDFYCAYREMLNVSGEEIKTLTVPRELPKKWDSELFKTFSYVTHSSVVYTRKAALEIPYNSALPALDDYDLISRFIEAKKKMVIDPTITVTYRRHGNGNISQNVDREYQKKLLHTIRTWRGWENEDAYID